MSGNHEGGLLARETNKERYGDSFYGDIGAKGGAAKTTRPKGFAAMDRQKFIEASRRGGMKSKRGEL